MNHNQRRKSVFRQVKIQRQFQQVLNLTKEQEKQLKELGFKREDIFALKFGVTVIIDNKAFSLNNPDTLPWNRKYHDHENINQNESRALKLMDELGLLIPENADKLLKKAISGNLDLETKSKILDLQITLKLDDKYSGKIDGIPGKATQEGMKQLVIENAPALLKSSRVLEQAQHSDNQIIIDPEKDGWNR